MSDDAFAPIKNTGASCTTHERGPKLQLVLPVPPDAPPAPDIHPTRGAPSSCWTYNNAKGELLGYVARFDSPGGRKIFHTLCLWRPAFGGKAQWRWDRNWPEPKPLYGLDRLAVRPGAPVLVVEGEKCADAAQRLLPGFVAVTSPQGASSSARADWTPLAGRAVLIWPDADEAGEKFLTTAAGELAKIGAASVAKVAPPKNVAVGWDAADAEAEGWDRARAEAFATSARPVPAETMEESPKKPRRPPARDSIVAQTEECVFWHSPEQVAYVTFPINSHYENWRVRSNEFKRWLSSRAYLHGGAVPNAQAIEDALRFLECRAINEGPRRKPWRRTGEVDGKIYLDLCDERWRVIEIRPGGWSVIDNPIVANVRSPAMDALPVPIKGAQSTDLRPFVNVASEDEYKLIVAWLIAALRPRGPYPVLLVNGEQGAGKSVLSKLLRSIIDPNIAPIRAASKDEEDLIVAAKNSHAIVLDNVSKINPAMADALCRVATGGGFSTRVKYTNDEEHVVWTCNPILANGIPSLADRPDLASRAIIVRLVSFADDKRLPEDEFWSQWERAAPGVLGTLCDALACALERLPRIKLTRPSRMADFEKLIEAASPALAWPAGAFASAYSANRKMTEAVAFEADPLAIAIERYFLDVLFGEPLTLTATELLARLQGAEAGGALLVSEGLRRSRSWPQTAQALGNRLDRIIPLLRARGIIVERRHSGDRKITIARLSTAR